MEFSSDGDWLFEKQASAADGEYIQTTDPKVRLYLCFGGHHYWHEDAGWLKNYSAFDSCFPDIDERLDRYKIGFPSFAMYKQDLNQHADTGSMNHSGMDRLAGGETLRREDYPAEVWRHLTTYVTAMRRHVRQIFASESVVYDTERKIAGTLDLVAEVHKVNGVPDGSVAVFDGKKGKIPFADNDVWLSAKVRVNEYALSWNQRNKPEATHAALIRTGTKHRDGFELCMWELRDDYHELFEAARKIYTALRPDPAPTIPEPMPDTLSLKESS